MRTAGHPLRPKESGNGEQERFLVDPVDCSRPDSSGRGRDSCRAVRVRLVAVMSVDAGEGEGESAEKGDERG